MVALSSIMSVNITGKKTGGKKYPKLKHHIKKPSDVGTVQIDSCAPEDHFNTHVVALDVSLWLWVIGGCSSSERRTIKPLLTGWRISCCQRGLKIGNVTSCGFGDIYCHSLHFYSFKPNALGACHHEQCLSHAQAQI